MNLQLIKGISLHLIFLRFLFFFLYIVSCSLLPRKYPYTVYLTLKLIEIESTESFRTGEVASGTVEILTSDSPIKFTLTTTQQVSSLYFFALNLLLL